MYATYRATILDSVLILSGTIRNQSGAMMAQAMTGLTTPAEEMPLHSAMKGEPLAGAWQRIVRIGRRLSGE